MGGSGSQIGVAVSPFYIVKRRDFAVKFGDSSFSEGWVVAELR
jgi:hypothetical protein